METPCACGGWLFARSERDIEDVVKAHNATERHRAWSLAQDPPELDAYEHRLAVQERPTGPESTR